MYANIRTYAPSWSLSGSVIHAKQHVDMENMEDEKTLSLCVAAMGGNACHILSHLRSTPPTERKRFLDRFVSCVVRTEGESVVWYKVRDITFALHPRSFSKRRIRIKRVWNAGDPHDN